MKVALVGYAGTGKTTILAIVERLIDWTVVDLDEMIAERSGNRTIVELFCEKGEEWFREAERLALQDCLKNRNIVVAVGGGAVTWPESLRLLVEYDRVIHLLASPGVILERIGGQLGARNRPRHTSRLTYAFIEAELRTRLPLYSGCATHAVQTDDRTTEEIASEVAAICLS